MDAVADIKARLSIEDVVSQYLELKRSGRNFKALSPFSQEKTPSLMISPEKQIWHDFSSGKGGDMFSFVMEIEGLDFVATLEILARQAGIDLSKYKTSKSGSGSKEKQKMLDCLELATKFYELYLQKNKMPLSYVSEKRGYNKKTINTFRFGYSPNKDTALVDFLRSKKIEDSIIQKAGLGTKRYRGFQDMFRGRLMIPLMDPSGLVVGFTARQLDSRTNVPKYINTPASPLYDKSRHVYGLHLAKESIRKQDFAVAVEGNLDVVASHQAGVNNVVATAGTAVTESHLKALARFTSDVRLAFDQDEAGLKATERVIPIAAKVGVNLSIITIPSGKDPDELIQNDASLWQDIIEKSDPVIDWIIERYQKILDIDSSLGKKQFSDKILAVITQLTDSVEQDHYYKKVSKILDVHEDALRQKALSQPQEKAVRLKPIAKQPNLDKLTVDDIRSQNKLLALVLFFPSLRSYLDKLAPQMLLQEPSKKMMQYLKAHPDYNLDSQKLPQELQDIEDYVNILSLVYEELYKNLEVIELRYEAARLQIRQIETYVKKQKGALSRALQKADDTQTGLILEKVKKLDILLKTAKETSK